MRIKKRCCCCRRGLTPPHRVKSISMATFTADEIELLKSRGNDYCKSVWLGLYDGAAPAADCRDEQTVKDLMVDKYERKRYYLDPAQALKNGYAKAVLPEAAKVKPLSSLLSDPKPIKLNGNATEFNRKRPEVGKSATTTTTFAVNFDNADIFTSNNNNNNNTTTTTQQQQESFANFDDNPVFTTSTNNSSEYLRVQERLLDKCGGFGHPSRNCRVRNRGSQAHIKGIRSERGVGRGFTFSD
jgi:Arf-GAP domain and FG repeat-containing protein 1